MHYKIPHTIPSLIQPLQTKGILNKVDDFYIFTISFGKQGGFTDRHAIIGVFIGQGICVSNKRLLQGINIVMKDINGDPFPVQPGGI
ncbi:hypothetical protein [Klebsiella quasipneumoniae]|uniref:hypothetical protein n=1 Tax=Klebsiella quasipneumoniae TaxID=1463165 RepID=UPI001E3CE83E|nr:hypothetical protein [Klebsiella quasipneumoniae]